MKILAMFAAALTALSLLGDEPAEPAEVTAKIGKFEIRAGEYIGGVGDDGTHAGMHLPFLRAFVVLRHPGERSAIVNMGVNGSSASSSIVRITKELDLVPCHRVLVAFGINEVEGSLFPLKDAGKRLVERDLAEYEQSLRKIVAEAKKRGAEVALMSPVPFDEYAPGDNRQEGRNAIALAGCAEVAEKVAKEEKLMFIDIHGPISKLLAGNPNLGLFMDDRIHPGVKGSLAVMREIVVQCGESPEIADVTVDTLSGEVTGSGASVAGMQKTEDGVSFSYRPESLPFPVTNSYKVLDKIVPMTDSLNLEKLHILGLEEGEYELLAGNTLLGKFTSRQLEAGVNLALLDTPNARRAMQVLELAIEQHRVAQKIRRCVQVYSIVQQLGAKPEDDDAAEKVIKTWLGGFRRTASQESYEAHLRMFDEYREWSPDFAKYVKKSNEIYAEMWKLAVPQEYVIVARRCGKF
ncbi:MAG: GDSL-type esterase/lipase family protein [Victivallaceae bacterium]|nr:GDSL-type esterase/lipase family protein [Victivallaceae bacterium]